MEEIKGLVSVTIPFFNAERFLRETIESVLAQSYATWELLLVDDGSSDGSSTIAQSYAARYPNKVFYLEHAGHRNLGLPAARNLGARHSQGEFLAFLDSDDVWLPDKLEHQVSLMNRYPEAGLIYGPSEWWYDWDGNAGVEMLNHIPSIAPTDKLYLPPSLLVCTQPIGSYGSPCPSSFLLRRDAFEQAGGFVEAFNPSTYQLCEDTAFLTKLYLNVPVYVTGHCSDRYRCHSQSMWHRAAGTKRAELALRFYFRWLRGYLKEHGFTSSEVWRAVRKAAWMYWMPLPAAVTLFVRRARNKLSHYRIR